MTAGRHGELLKLKTVLGQISETGTASNKLFAQSIRDLYETVLASNLNNAEFIANLLVDLLDRNLYERSDDCRWWALTPELRAALAETERSEATIARLNGILEYINKLYTVYTRIFVYDRNGIILASTNPLVDGESVVGTSIGEEALERVLALNSEQHYHVSPFEASALYGNAPTYIYHAAIRHPEQAAPAVGGIGIVFDASAEFTAMLQGALPDQASMSAFFIDRTGGIIASTDAARPVGGHLAIDPDLLALENGRSAARIVVHDGSHAIMGCTVSNGYREFKRTDGYREDVIGVVFHTLGKVMETGASTSRPEPLAQTPLDSGDTREFATFLIDGDLFAVAAENVTEAIPAANISPISVGARPERIGILDMHGEDGSKEFAWVFDLGYLVRGKPSVTAPDSPVIIIRRGAQTIGVLVNELHGVPEFDASALTQTPLLSGNDGMLVPWVIKANGGRLLIQVVDADYLFRLLMAQETPMLAYG